jgi:phosphatidylserine/phosphatidylglycerophosphate/cardiolipin synthase-like enzyme
MKGALFYWFCCCYLSLKMFKINPLLFFLLLIAGACQDKTEAPAKELQGTAIHAPFPDAVFTDPLAVASNQASPIIMDRLVALIDATPQKATIHMSIYLFDYPAIVEALKRADKRGVGLYLMIDRSRQDSQETNPATISVLSSQLKTNTPVVICESDASASAINHNKFVLFSVVNTSQGPVEHLVFQTSHNFTLADSRKIQDALVLPHQGLYRAYLTYWQDMAAKAGKGMQDFYYREYTDAAAGITAYFFPKRRNGQAYGGDTIIEILEDITDPASATIRVGMSDWVLSRKNVLDKLTELHTRGARVEIVAKSSADPEILTGLEKLREKGAFVKIYNMSRAGQPKINIHAKFMLIEGQWRGRQATVLVTGSHNFTTNALRNNNEAMLLLQDHALFNAYKAHYEQLKALPGLVP